MDKDNYVANNIILTGFAILGLIGLFIWFCMSPEFAATIAG